MTPPRLSSTGLDSVTSPHPPVTAVVAAYKHEKFVYRCLDSVLETGYPNLQFVITNDASPDGTGAEITRWIRDHPDVDVTFIDNEENRGVTRVLNTAVGKATGDFICFIAGDDLMLANGISDRVDYLQRNPDKLAVFGDCRVIDDEGELIHESGLEFGAPPGFAKEDLLVDALIPFSIVFYWTVPGPVFACRKECFEVVGPYDESLLVEDWDMYLRAAATGRLGYVDRFVSSYRIHGDNWSRSTDGSIQVSFRQTLLDNYEKTVFANINRFSGICRWRMLAYALVVKAKTEQKQPARLLLTIWSALMMSLSFRAHLLASRLYRARSQRQGQRPGGSDELRLEEAL